MGFKLLATAARIFRLTDSLVAPKNWRRSLCPRMTKLTKCWRQMASLRRELLQGAAAGFYSVAEIDGRVVGCLMITHEWTDWRDGNLWWIQSVYVHPEARRRGVFRALFDGVRSRAEADRDVRGIRLYVERDNDRARRTYESFGMTEKPYRIYELLVDGD